MLYGDGGAGKTTFSIDLAFHLGGRRRLAGDACRPRAPRA
jgi:RecA-family ATPase